MEFSVNATFDSKNRRNGWVDSNTENLGFIIKF